MNKKISQKGLRLGKYYKMMGFPFFWPTNPFFWPTPLFSDPQPLFSDPPPFFSDPQPFFSDPRPFFFWPPTFSLAFSDACRSKPFFSDLSHSLLLIPHPPTTLTTCFAAKVFVLGFEPPKRDTALFLPIAKSTTSDPYPNSSSPRSLLKKKHLKI